MDTAKLSEYVVGRMRVGAAKPEIKEELVTIGWTEDEAEAAYRAGVIALGAPVPTEGSRPHLSRKASAVDVVINFFSFILLGIVATAVGTLYFQIVNLAFPDPLSGGWYAWSASVEAVHYATAALLIGFPLYYLAMRLWFRQFREDAGRAESKLSRWLTYLVLLVAAVTVVGDLIAIVNSLLQGEITVRFFLKALTILAIAAAIFGFYYLERKKIQYQKDIPRSTFLNFGRGVAAAVVVGIVLGFVLGGSPADQRARSLDATRSENLANLSGCIEQYAASLGALPASLDELERSSQFNYCVSSSVDPETGAPYEYRVVTPSKPQGSGMVGEFELCADFATATLGMATDLYGMSGVWYEHQAGRDCDTVSAQLMVPESGMKSPDVPAPATLPIR